MSVDIEKTLQLVQQKVDILSDLLISRTKVDNDIHKLTHTPELEKLCVMRERLVSAYELVNVEMETLLEKICSTKKQQIGDVVQRVESQNIC